MRLNRLRISAPFAHFKIPYSSKFQDTYPVPPLSTVIGMLKVIYGEDINHFTFGYTFESEVDFIDGYTLHKLNKDVKKNQKGYINDYCMKKYLHRCCLTVYTDIPQKICMNHALTMGKSNCLANLHFPVEEVDLTDKPGKGYNQFTPVTVGTGEILPVTVMTKFNHQLGSFDTNIKHLRLNKEFDAETYHDEERNQNVFLWSYKDGEVDVY